MKFAVLPPRFGKRGDESPVPAGVRRQHGSGCGGSAGWEEEVAELALALEVSPQGFALRCSPFPRANPAPSPRACQVSILTTLMVPVPGASARVCSRCFSGVEEPGRTGALRLWPCCSPSLHISWWEGDTQSPVWGAGCPGQAWICPPGHS